MVSPPRPKVLQTLPSPNLPPYHLPPLRASRNSTSLPQHMPSPNPPPTHAITMHPSASLASHAPEPAYPIPIPPPVCPRDPTVNAYDDYCSSPFLIDHISWTTQPPPPSIAQVQQTSLATSLLPCEFPTIRNTVLYLSAVFPFCFLLPSTGKCFFLQRALASGHRAGQFLSPAPLVN